MIPTEMVTACIERTPPEVSPHAQTRPTTAPQTRSVREQVKARIVVTALVALRPRLRIPLTATTLILPQHHHVRDLRGRTSIRAARVAEPRPSREFARTSIGLQRAARDRITPLRLTSVAGTPTHNQAGERHGLGVDASSEAWSQCVRW